MICSFLNFFYIIDSFFSSLERITGHGNMYTGINFYYKPYVYDREDMGGDELSSVSMMTFTGWFFYWVY
jgi:hypothetical protein